MSELPVTYNFTDMAKVISAHGFIDTAAGTGQDNRAGIKAFSVFREFDNELYSTIWDNKKIQAVTDQFPDVFTYGRTQTSLITPREGRVVTKRWKRDRQELRLRLEAKTSEFAETVEGWLGSVVMFGSTSPHIGGSRFIGYELIERPARMRIMDERNALLSEVSKPALFKEFEPHVSLFRTKDYETAVSIFNQLDKIGPNLAAFTLQAAIVRPLTKF
jgi:hypothetical protein